MDDLIKNLKSCKLEKKELDLVNLLDELENIKAGSNNGEWEYFKNNYLKLKYLDTLFKSDFIIAWQNGYIDSLKIYLDKLDEKTKYYLKEIDWDFPNDYYHDTKRVQKFFEESLVTKYPYKKLNILLKAYKLVCSITEINIEQYEIDDDDFLATFQPLKKQRKN